jgi:hypothetical protein
MAVPLETSFTVIRGLWGNDVVCRGEPRRVNAELGDAWVDDFSAVAEEGVYQIHCGSATSRLVMIHKAVYDQALRVLSNYYPTQRCGDSLTGWNALWHLVDARRADTDEQMDLVGGWHQSGDLTQQGTMH